METWGEVVWEVSCVGSTLINTEYEKCGRVFEELHTERDRGCDKVTAKMVIHHAMCLCCSEHQEVALLPDPWTWTGMLLEWMNSMRQK